VGGGEGRRGSIMRGEGGNRGELVEVGGRVRTPGREWRSAMA